MIETLDINGDPPDLKGRTLEELLVKSYRYDGLLEEEANVIFLKVDDGWYRLYFDFGIIFWRSGEEQPKAYKFQNNDGTYSEFSIIDLGKDRELIGRTIEGYTMFAIEGGSRVDIQFEDGRTVSFQCIGDNTKIITQSGSRGNLSPQE